MTNQFLLSLISGIFISGSAAYLGTIMLSKRMTIVADPLGHLALPGAALGLIYGFNVSVGAFPFVILGIFIIWYLEMKTKLPMETLSAIVFAAGIGIAFLFLPIDKAEMALIGDISKVGFIETAVSVILGIAVFVTVNRSYSKIILTNINEDVAKVEGVNVKLYNLIYLIAVAIIVALGVNLVGGLMTAALVAIPAAASKNISKSLNQYSFISGIIGVISAIVGITFAELTGYPAGPLVIITSGIIFLFTLPGVKL